MFLTQRCFTGLGGCQAWPGRRTRLPAERDGRTSERPSPPGLAGQRADRRLPDSRAAPPGRRGTRAARDGGTEGRALTPGGAASPRPGPAAPRPPAAPAHASSGGSATAHFQGSKSWGRPRAPAPPTPPGRARGLACLGAETDAPGRTPMQPPATPGPRPAGRPWTAGLRRPDFGQRARPAPSGQREDVLAPAGGAAGAEPAREASGRQAPVRAVPCLRDAAAQSGAPRHGLSRPPLEFYFSSFSPMQRLGGWHPLPARTPGPAAAPTAPRPPPCTGLRLRDRHDVALQRRAARARGARASRASGSAPPPRPLRPGSCRRPSLDVSWRSRRSSSRDPVPPRAVPHQHMLRLGGVRAVSIPANASPRPPAVPEDELTATLAGPSPRGDPSWRRERVSGPEAGCASADDPAGRSVARPPQLLGLGPGTGTRCGTGGRRGSRGHRPRGHSFPERRCGIGHRKPASSTTSGRRPGPRRPSRPCRALQAAWRQRPCWRPASREGLRRPRDLAGPGRRRGVPGSGRGQRPGLLPAGPHALRAEASGQHGSAARRLGRGRRPGGSEGTPHVLSHSFTPPARLHGAF